ncbi:hypothetical protein KX928_17400 [Roseobacter sp. YSTF-M11]|uniref:Uncharacterized protein n=1 Tax=Roseobacter insulae TaxID=2859783 RepID=A0A9X1FWW7_9RHOB|nr:hypothetical protein [Roseobacter insulae]MBW4709565.1 hypothetical protein [Roseobacter insulae]
MGWQPTTQAALEDAARAAIVAAFPLVVGRSYDPRPVPNETVPAFAIRVEHENAEPAGLNTTARLISGTIRAVLWVKAPETDRLDLADLADHIRAVILADSVLANLTGSLDPSDNETEIQTEAERFARIECLFAAQWLESPTETPSILARFGLA